jgi:hypothetical protein
MQLLRKGFLVLLVLALLLTSSLAILCNVVAQGGASVTGVIIANTTWTKANSPYSLTGNILVKEGVTLTLEAGVTVNLNSYYILVNGTVQSKGTASENIYINGIDGSPPPIPMGSTLAISFSYGITIKDYPAGGSTFENTNIHDVRLALGTFDAIRNCTITGFVSAGQNSNITNSDIVGVVVGSGTTEISNNKIIGGIEAEYGSPSILNNTISSGAGGGSGIQFLQTDSITISGNTIWACDMGIYALGNGAITNNFISNNDQGIAIYNLGVVSIQGNTLQNNGVGIKLHAGTISSLTNNNLENPSLNIILDVATNLDATNNWWGTTDSQAINKTIYDFKNDFNLGTVTFTPFLTAPNSQAPKSPIPTPSAIPSPTLPNLGPTSSPTHSIPEISALAVLPLLAGMFLVALKLRPQKPAA